MKITFGRAAGTCLALFSLINVSAQQKYDLLLKGGHVIDSRKRICEVGDVEFAYGKVEEVAANIGDA
jgi:hypothetical protein